MRNLPAVLTVIFIVLKLTETIDWSWWWVLSPVPISLAVYIIVMTLIYTIIELIKRAE